MQDVNIGWAAFCLSLISDCPISPEKAFFQLFNGTSAQYQHDPEFIKTETDAMFILKEMEGLNDSDLADLFGYDISTVWYRLNKRFPSNTGPWSKPY